MNEGESGSAALNFPDAIYAGAFDPCAERMRVVVGSLVLSSRNNWICVASARDESLRITPRSRVAQSYPATRLRWCPRGGPCPDSFVATSDCLRLFRVDDAATSLAAEFRNTRVPEIAGPYTSCDWSSAQPELVCCSSVDSTCTIWDLHAQKKNRQVIVHEREVLDVCFARGPFQFATVGADCTLNLFDTRELNSCSLLFQAAEPLLRVEFNSTGQWLAVSALKSPEVYVVDPRRPLEPLFRLRKHAGPVNALGWSPTASDVLCTVGDDRCALLWHLAGQTGAAAAPKMEYHSAAPLVGCAWSAAQPDCIGMLKEKSFNVIKAAL